MQNRCGAPSQYPSGTCGRVGIRTGRGCVVELSVRRRAVMRVDVQVSTGVHAPLYPTTSCQ